jgi:hypothetical protein
MLIYVVSPCFFRCTEVYEWAIVAVCATIGLCAIALTVFIIVLCWLRKKHSLLDSKSADAANVTVLKTHKYVYSIYTHE